jgi:hypothetical protein
MKNCIVNKRVVYPYISCAILLLICIYFILFYFILLHDYFVTILAKASSAVSGRKDLPPTTSSPQQRLKAIEVVKEVVAGKAKVTPLLQLMMMEIISMLPLWAMLSRLGTGLSPKRI